MDPTQAHQAVEAAARDAARQASLARDPTTARSDALASAQTTLASDGLACAPVVSVDTGGFARPLGQPAVVTARVTWIVRLADVAAIGVPPVTISARFSSPLDPYRGRQS